MTVQKIVTKIVDCVPERVFVALRGKRGSPNWLANVIHRILNRANVERFPVLDCGGVLKGFRMRVDWTKHRSFAYGTWEPEVIEIIRQYVRPGMIVMDIGAHSGFFVLLLSRIVGPEGWVTAFEPLPANFRVLKENVELNNLKNVELRPEAVGSRSGHFNFEVPDASNLLVAGLLGDDEKGIVKVPVVSLDDFLIEDGRKVDFILMDVEGAEGDIIEGAQKTLEEFRPTMMVELHNLDRYKHGHPVAARLERIGYNLRGLSEAGYTMHVLALPGNGEAKA